MLLGGGDHPPAELDLSPDRPDYVTTDGVEVWMERKRQKTRFLDDRDGQVGPVHSNLAPAIVWARAQGWRDPSLPDWFNDAAIAEVRAGAGRGCGLMRELTRMSIPAAPGTGKPRHGHQVLPREREEFPCLIRLAL